MRLILRILKHTNTQKLPGCFLTTHSKGKSFTYSFNAPENIHKDWAYFKFSQSEQGFRVFFSHFSLNRISGLFSLISQLGGRTGLTRFSYFGCNRFLKYYPFLKQSFGVKFLKMSAASFESNEEDYVGMVTTEQIKSFFERRNEGYNIQQDIKRLFQRQDIHAVKDYLKYPSSNCKDALPFYEDNAIKIYAIDVSNQNQKERRYAFHVCEALDEKISINKEQFMKDIPSKFRKQIISQGKIQIDDKIYDLNDYQTKEKSSHLLILDLESEEEITRLLQNSGYMNSADQKAPSLFSQVSLIIHLSPKEVLESAEYTKFIIETSKQNINHIVTASGYCSKSHEQDANSVGSVIPYAFLNYNSQLVKIFPNIFPVMEESLFFTWSNKYLLNSPIEKAPFFDEKGRVMLAKQVEQIHIKNTEITRISLPPTSISMYSKVIHDLMRAKLLESVFQKLTKLNNDQLQKYQFPTIIPLGTSSSMATMLRNESSYLIQTSETSSVLFDCGSSTFYQLIKQYSDSKDSKKLANELIKIRVVFISHQHSDHHFGLPEFLQLRNDILPSDSPPLLVITPQYLIKSLEALRFASKKDLNAVFIPHDHVSKFSTGKQSKRNLSKLLRYFQEDLTDVDDNLDELAEENKDEEIQLASSQLERKQKDVEIFNSTLKDCQIKSFQIFPIFHCKNSRSISCELTNGKKIVYSGDGRPQKNFKSYLKDADFLIHECTFTHEQSHSAILKNHSYLEEVASLAIELSVKCLILSHFSTNKTVEMISNKINNSSYSYNFPNNREIEQYINTNTIFAADHLIIRPSYTHSLPQISRIVLKLQHH